jgi:hypothetical protein
MLRAILACSALLAPASLTLAATRNVPSQYSTIQAAINASADGDNIVVAPGVYREAIVLNGKAVTLRSSAGPALTTIDAATLTANSVIRCVNGEGPDTVIDGFTVTGGSGTLENNRRKGGGMLNKNASPTVVNCVFRANEIRAYEFEIEGSGAGMYNENAHPTVRACTFVENELLGCNGWLNGGAGMYNDNSSPMVAECRFENNAGNNGGGMMNINGANPTVVNCHFEGNTVTYSGGGMNLTNGASATVTNCVFTANESWHGAALYSYSSDMQLSSCTIYANVAERAGGAAYVFYPTADTRLANSVLWNNVGALEPANAEIGHTGAAPTVRSSVVKGGYPGVGVIAANPQFENAAAGDFRLKDGSPALDVGEDDFLPMDTMDLDGDGVFFEILPVDMNGDTRLAGVGLDMGAFERPSTDGGPANNCPADLTPEGGDGFISIGDILLVIAAFNTPCNNCPEDIAPPGGDNQVSIDDVLAFVQAFGPCPE